MPESIQQKMFNATHYSERALSCFKLFLATLLHLLSKSSATANVSLYDLFRANFIEQRKIYWANYYTYNNDRIKFSKTVERYKHLVEMIDKTARTLNDAITQIQRAVETIQTFTPNTPITAFETIFEELDEIRSSSWRKILVSACEYTLAEKPEENLSDYLKPIAITELSKIKIAEYETKLQMVLAPSIRLRPIYTSILAQYENWLPQNEEVLRANEKTFLQNIGLLEDTDIDSILSPHSTSGSPTHEAEAAFEKFLERFAIGETPMPELLRSSQRSKLPAQNLSTPPSKPHLLSSSPEKLLAGLSPILPQQDPLSSPPSSAHSKPLTLSELEEESSVSTSSHLFRRSLNTNPRKLLKELPIFVLIVNIYGYETGGQKQAIFSFSPAVCALLALMRENQITLEGNLAITRKICLLLEDFIHASPTLLQTIRAITGTKHQPIPLAADETPQIPVVSKTPKVNGPLPQATLMHLQEAIEQLSISRTSGSQHSVESFTTPLVALVDYVLKNAILAKTSHDQRTRTSEHPIPAIIKHCEKLLPETMRKLFQILPDVKEHLEVIGPADDSDSSMSSPVPFSLGGPLDVEKHERLQKKKQEKWTAQTRSAPIPGRVDDTCPLPRIVR